MTSGNPRPRADIVVVAKDPAGGYGGSESYVRATARAIRRAGYAPHIFCVGTRSSREETDLGTVHRAWSPFRPLRALMVAFQQPLVVARVNRWAKGRTGPFLIHGLGPWGGVAHAVSRSLRRRGHDTTLVTTPFTSTRHEALGKVVGVGRHYPLSTRLRLRAEYLWTTLLVDPNERRGFRNSDLVVPNYESVRKIIGDDFGPGISFGRMTYCSELAFTADETAERRADMAWPAALDAAPLIVSVSRHDPRKGLDVLLKALALLKARGVAFRACLLGTGELLETHRRLARSLGLGGETTIAGVVSEVYSTLRKADIFVLPSIEEGSGSVALLEAMQAGVAPVVSRLDGLPEDVTEGESALLVTPGDVDDLARALTACLTDADLRLRLGQGAHARYLARFSAQAYADDIARIYTSLGFPPPPAL